MIIQELTENILEPLDQIEKAADDMAHGNLEIDISYQGEDELGKLAESFRNTSFYLRGVVDDINQLLTEFAKETLMRDPMILKPIREISVKF